MVSNIFFASLIYFCRFSSIAKRKKSWKKKKKRSSKRDNLLDAIWVASVTSYRYELSIFRYLFPRRDRIETESVTVSIASCGSNTPKLILFAENCSQSWVHELQSAYWQWAKPYIIICNNNIMHAAIAYACYFSSSSSLRLVACVLTRLIMVFFGSVRSGRHWSHTQQLNTHTHAHSDANVMREDVMCNAERWSIFVYPLKIFMELCCVADLCLCVRAPVTLPNVL